MPTTQTMRQDFPEFVRSVNPLRCNTTSASRVPFLASTSWPGERVSLAVHPAASDAFSALSAVLAKWGYRFREPGGGTFSCRKITGGGRTSLHAHGIAADFNPSANGYRSAVGVLDYPETSHVEGVLQWSRFTDMPPGMIRAIERIKTKGGVRVWQWGGRFRNVKDAMHFQINCRRVQLAAGIDWATVDGVPLEPIQEDDVTLKRGNKGRAVADLQAALIADGYDLGTFTPFLPGYPAGADGAFGPGTAAEVSAFQNAYGLPATGEADGVTLALLFDATDTDTPHGEHPDTATLAQLQAHADNPDAHHE